MKYYSPLLDTITEGKDDSWLIPLYDELSVFPNTSFLPGTEFQFAWDSVSLTKLKTCPRRYKFEIIEGYRLNPMPVTLHFGIAFHTCMETWHKLLALGTDKDTALLRVTRLALLLGEYFYSLRNERTKETLCRAVIWYLDQFRDDPAETVILNNGTPAVEYSFTVPLFEVNGIQVYLSGHMDRVVSLWGEIWLTDYKTSGTPLDSRFADKYKPDAQLLGYLAAAHILAGSTSAVPETPAGMIIDGIQLGVNFNRFQRFPIIYTPLEIEDYLTDLRPWIETAAHFAEARHWPANETACEQYGGCPFKSVCSQTPPRRQRILDEAYVKSTWDPRRAR